VLADHIIVKNLADLFRGRDAVLGLDEGNLVLFADDVHAQFDAFIADEHGRARNQLADLVLALAAERAVERALGVAAGCLRHRRLSLSRRYGPGTAGITPKDVSAPSLQTTRHGLSKS